MRRIEVMAYRQEWPGEFLRLAGAIREAVGEEVLRIDHIGSTSVPGLSAKDVIDIQVTVSDLDDRSVVEALVELGYLFKERNTRDLLVGTARDSRELRKLFFREKPGERAANIHIRELGRVNQRYPLLFRDYLRAFAPVREAYGQVKRELAQRFPEDEDAYYAIKDPYMDTVYFAAEAWAKEVGWEMDGAFV